MKRVLLLACVAVLPGCLERRITVTSDPPGATVFINDTDVGRTPLTTGFQFYGEYDVRVRKPGFEPISTHRTASSPLWEYPPLDIAAIAVPVSIQKNVKWNFELSPVSEESTKGLVERAKELRAQAIPEPAK